MAERVFELIGAGDCSFELMRWLVADRSPEFARVFVAAQKTVPTEEWWGGGRARMLVIQGKQDRVAPVGNGHDLRARFPASAP